MGFLKNALSTRRAMQELPPMKEIHYISDEELRQLQACFLEIIKDIDRVCRENGICYMAAGGTALGSIRHQGFIPWDDDVDLLMPRPDLKRFLEIFDRCLGDKYEITIYSSCCNMDKGIYYYKTYENSQITAVDMHKENLDGDTIITYPLIKGQQIHYCN